MSCKFSNFQGICDFFEDGIERPTDVDGACLCEDDTNPEDLCEDYEER